VSRVRDAVVVGGGPAGLAFAAAAAARGLDVLVAEPRPYPIDKACGEGLLPAGLRALRALGVEAALDPAEATPLRAIRWIDAAGGQAEAALPAPGGLGLRRTALSRLLLERALAAGAELLPAGVEDHRRAPGGVTVQVGGQEVQARLLVAADGLGSRVRRREGLDLPVAGPARFGLRRHLACPAPGDAVEVHLGTRAEAYLTPVGSGRLGVAFLFEGRAEGGWPALLARFPALAARLEGASPWPGDLADRGAGPLARGSSARVLDRLALLGDAAGYLDAITGDGLSLALAGALDLAALAPEAIARGAPRQSLLPYERAWRRRYGRYRRWTRLMLTLSRRPGLRRRTLALGGAWPAGLERLVARAVG
jgi:flavin-dependent dehydrogenase